MAADKVIRVGSRASALAVAQAQIVVDAVKAAHPELAIKIVKIRTGGDMRPDADITAIGGKGLFVKEIDQALLDGDIDIAVHSLKDMPMEQPEGLVLAAIPKRGRPEDVIIWGSAGEVLEPVIGTSSLRRRLQLGTLMPRAQFVPIRGNVPTRLEKLDAGACDAVVLAAAGLIRLGLDGRISGYLDKYDVIPAAGQGALGIVGRAGESYPWLECTNDPGTFNACTAERAFVRRMGGGCRLPSAAYAYIEDGNLYISGLYFDEGTGRHIKGKKIIKGLCSAAEFEAAGIAFADELREKLENG